MAAVGAWATGSGVWPLSSRAARTFRTSGDRDRNQTGVKSLELLAQVAPLRRAFGPLISGLQVLPSVAWVPAAILWFGITDATVYFVVFMVRFPRSSTA